MSKHETTGQTGHKQVPGDVTPGAPDNATDALPMGMTGAAGGADPDQKSTHKAPKTVESTLPDGSPKFADPEAVKAKPAAKTGKYVVVSRIITKVDGKSKTFEPEQEVELEAAQAESLGDAVKPAGK